MLMVYSMTEALSWITHYQSWESMVSGEVQQLDRVHSYTQVLVAC